MNKSISNIVFTATLLGAAILFWYLVYCISSNSGEERYVSGLALMIISLAALDGLKISRYFSNPTAEDVFHSNEIHAGVWYFLVAFLCALYVHFEFNSANIYSYIFGFFIYKFARVIFIKNLATIF